ncbi:hypothetical protein LXL04_012267 [Taraxacum kok-saghyz]
MSTSSQYYEGHPQTSQETRPNTNVDSVINHPRLRETVSTVVQSLSTREMKKEMTKEMTRMITSEIKCSFLNFKLVMTFMNLSWWLLGPYVPPPNSKDMSTLRNPQLLLKNNHFKSPASKVIEPKGDMMLFQQIFKELDRKRLHGVDEKLSGIILGGSNLAEATPPRDVNFAGGEVVHNYET